MPNTYSLFSALRLAELGYSVFQCTPRDKTPFVQTAIHGCNSATTDLDTITKWWTKYPDCNIGIKCCNLLVFDLDCKDDIDGANDLCKIIKAIGKLPDSPLSRTGSGGWHLIFAKPNIEIVGTKKIKWQGNKTGIDIQTGNQYIIAPPSIHPNGNHYQWQTPPCNITQLPQLPNEWIDQVLPKRQNIVATSPVIPPPILNTQSDLVSRCRAYVTTMPSAIQGQCGQSDLLRVANVIFHGFGLSESEGWQIILEYNARCCPPWDLTNPKDEKDFRRKIKQAIENPTSNQSFAHLQNHTTTHINIETLVANLAKPTIVNSTETHLDAERIPERLQHVPGFIGKLVQFCVDSSPYPNRILALCGAIALMSFLIIRKVQYKSGTRPNIYIIAIATSGTGKDYIRKVNKHILSMTGQLNNIGESIASGEGMEDEILCHRKKLFQTDEIQTLIRGITMGKNNGALDYAATFLMSIFTSSDTDYIGRAKAGNQKKESRTVNQPGLILFGTTTPNAFFNSLSSAFLEDGLGSRTMFIEGNTRSDFNKNALDHSNVPTELIDIARWWTEFTPVNPKTGEIYNLYDERPEPIVIPTTPEAEAIINRLGLQADNNYRKTNDGIEQTAWTRARENAIKLAMIYACSASYEQPMIDADAASWATEFVYWMQNKMVDMIRKHVADQPFTKQCLRAKDIIRKHRGIIPRAELSKIMRIRPRELDEVIQSLITEESIELIVETSNTKPRTLYKLVMPDTT